MPETEELKYYHLADNDMRNMEKRVTWYDVPSSDLLTAQEDGLVTGKPVHHPLICTGEKTAPIFT